MKNASLRVKKANRSMMNKYFKKIFQEQKIKMNKKNSMKGI